MLLKHQIITHIFLCEIEACLPLNIHIYDGVYEKGVSHKKMGFHFLIFLNVELDVDSDKPIAKVVSPF